MDPTIFTDSAEIPTIHDDAKRTIKDSVFRNLFSQKKYLLQLYQALHPEDKNVTKADLEYVTLQPPDDTGRGTINLVCEYHSKMCHVSCTNVERLLHPDKTKCLFYYYSKFS